MIDAITNLTEWKFRTKTKRPEARVAPEVLHQPEVEQCGQRFGFTKMFRWPVPAGGTSPPTTVEIVGSFTGWQAVPLAYDKATNTWQTALDNIESNHTHRYVILVDGKPSYDKTCDGLAAPECTEEAKWQIETPRGPRVMLLFAQTK
jgi:hypothetical protein